MNSGTVIFSDHIRVIGTVSRREQDVSVSAHCCPEVEVVCVLRGFANTAQAVAVLNATLSGNGSGAVTSNLAGIDCPARKCSAPFGMGTVVSLAAAASAGSTFTGWSGACSGKGACNVTLSSDQNVSANFTSPDFSVSATALAPASVVAGHSATSTVTIASMNSFNSAVQFSCSVDPAPALAPACSLNPPSATPAANAAVSSTLTVNTTAPTIALAGPAAARG